MDNDYSNNLMPRKPRPTQRGNYSGTVIVLLIAVMLSILFSVWTVAFAQTSESTSVSGANSEVDVETGAVAGSQINNYGQKAGKENTVYAEVASAPSLGGLALGGGHPCAYSPATAQISVIGGGAGVGGMKVDSACMLMVMGAAGDPKAYKASHYIIAARDPLACRAMESAGMIGEGSCPDKRLRLGGGAKKDWSKPAAVSSKSAAAGWGAKCELVGKRLAFQPTTASARDAELSACKARYRL